MGSQVFGIDWTLCFQPLLREKIKELATAVSKIKNRKLRPKGRKAKPARKKRSLQTLISLAVYYDE